MTTLQVRIDEKEKEMARAVLDHLGLDISSAVKVFLRAVIREQGIPFRITTENGFTVEAENRMIQETKQALNGKKRFKNTSQLFQSLDT